MIVNKLLSGSRHACDHSAPQDERSGRIRASRGAEGGKKGVRGKSTCQKVHITLHSCNARVAKIVFSRNINNVSCPKISFFSVEITQKRRPSRGGAPLVEAYRRRGEARSPRVHYIYKACGLTSCRPYRPCRGHPSAFRACLPSCRRSRTRW